MLRCHTGLRARWIPRLPAERRASGPSYALCVLHSVTDVGPSNFTSSLSLSRVTFQTICRQRPAGEALPTQLLTPFQAENDDEIRDAYAYATILTDVEMPRRFLQEMLHDTTSLEAYSRAISLAVDAIESRDMDCRVLNVGAGGGMHAMMALKAGARHVTCTERWLYLASACKDVMSVNGFPSDRLEGQRGRLTLVLAKGMTGSA